MKELGYYNGTVGELSEMTVPMSDRASWFGDGVYDAQLCRNYRIFGLDEHVNRFFRSARLLEMEPPFAKEELKDLLCTLVRKMDTGSCFVYYQLTRGAGPRSHAYPAGKPNLWVTITPREVNEGRTPVALITAEDIRFELCHIKTLNLIPSVMASEKAKRAGAHEAVLYRRGGRVTECAHSNVHILLNGELRTAPLDHWILPGTARARLLRICERLSLPVNETPFTLEEMMEADEVLLTSSSNLILHADRVDGKPVGMRLPDLYEQLRSEVLGEFFRETEGE